MSDSGRSDRSRHRYRHHSPLVAFYGPAGVNEFAGDYYEARDYNGTRLGYAQYGDHRELGRRDVSPRPSMCSWLVEAIESLCDDLKKSGSDSRKASKSDANTAREEKHCEQNKAAIEGMSAKIVKLEEAMKSVQDTLQSCLDKLRKGQDAAAARPRGHLGNRSPAGRERRRRSPVLFHWE